MLGHLVAARFNIKYSYYLFKMIKFFKGPYNSDSLFEKGVTVLLLFCLVILTRRKEGHILPWQRRVSVEFKYLCTQRIKCLIFPTLSWFCAEQYRENRIKIGWTIYLGDIFNKRLNMIVMAFYNSRTDHWIHLFNEIQLGICHKCTTNTNCFGYCWL
jgi:hypothetical protein